MRMAIKRYMFSKYLCLYKSNVFLIITATYIQNVFLMLVLFSYMKLIFSVTQINRPVTTSSCPWQHTASLAFCCRSKIVTTATSWLTPQAISYILVGGCFCFLNSLYLQMWNFNAGLAHFLGFWPWRGEGWLYNTVPVYMVLGREKSIKTTSLW